MIKIKGKKGDLDIRGSTNEIIAELSIVIDSFSEAFALAKGIPLSVATSHIMNQINTDLYKKRTLKEKKQGGE